MRTIVCSILLAAFALLICGVACSKPVPRPSCKYPETVYQCRIRMWDPANVSSAEDTSSKHDAVVSCDAQVARFLCATSERIARNKAWIFVETLTTTPSATAIPNVFYGWIADVDCKADDINNPPFGNLDENDPKIALQPQSEPGATQKGLTQLVNDGWSIDYNACSAPVDTIVVPDAGTPNTINDPCQELAQAVSQPSSDGTVTIDACGQCFARQCCASFMAIDVSTPDGIEAQQEALDELACFAGGSGKCPGETLLPSAAMFTGCMQGFCSGSCM